MIELIVPYINTRIESLNLFKDRFELCERIKDGEVVFPACYIGKGEYKQVSDFDKQDGTIYHRQTGEVSSQESDEESTVSCQPFIERTYPMRTVGIIKKTSYSAYEDSLIAEYVSNAIEFINNKSLRQALKADVIGVEVKSISTDREKIFKEEYEGVDKTIPYEYIYFAIDYNIKITGNVSCFATSTCGDYSIDYSTDYR